MTAHVRVPGRWVQYDPAGVAHDCPDWHDHPAAGLHPDGGFIVTPDEQPAPGVYDPRKDDGDKPAVEYLPTRPLLDVGEVMSFGARKYGPRNWEGGLAWSRIYGAALRHLYRWNAGEDLDPETGKSHLAHASACLLMLAEYERTHPELDDRP